MKKLIFLLLILSLPLIVSAQTCEDCPKEARLGLAIVGGSNPPASTCNVATNEIGARDIGSDDTNIYADVMVCNLASADCSGTLATGYLYSIANNGSLARVCIYSDDGDSLPGVEDLKLSCTTNLLDDAITTWLSSSMDTATSVTLGTNYWICFASKTANWLPRYGSGGSYQTHACSGCADSPPATLTGTWSNVGSYYTSMYVTIQ